MLHLYRHGKLGQFDLLEFKAKKELKPWVLPVLRLMNEVYAAGNIYGYAPLDDQEMMDLAKKYMPVIDPRFIKVVAKGGEVIAFVAGIPDMTEGIQKARGRLLPFGWWHLLRALKKYEILDFYLAGFLKKYRGLGVDLLMVVQMARGAVAKGFRFTESNQELETNTKIQAQWKYFNPVQHKRKQDLQESLEIGG